MKKYYGRKKETQVTWTGRSSGGAGIAIMT
jgi:hypothetical protein